MGWILVMQLGLDLGHVCLCRLLDFGFGSDLDPYLGPGSLSNPDLGSETAASIDLVLVLVLRSSFANFRVFNTLSYFRTLGERITSPR